MRLNPSSRYRWLVLTLVFGIGPMAIYFLFINPAISRLSECRELMRQQANRAPLIDMKIPHTEAHEAEDLQEVRLEQLSRIKKIGNRESLLRFSGTLSDALALQARSFGLRVTEVSLQNPLISGKYVPAGDSAMEALDKLSGPRWEELADPLDLPMMRIPSIEVRIKVVSEYSQVFSFIESLSDFPALVQLTALQIMDDSAGKAYQLTIRGYYCANENIKQIAQLENTAYR
ncbi:MAG TPA: hypothetical protein VMG30_17390 [Acidobacteriota bacterium]|nr:hypothetical protein [Acidobacteriota bacterium]